MTVFHTESLDISKIKLRWEEPYTSEGFNRKMTSLPPGIYRGGSAGPEATPSQSFVIGPDGDGSGLYTDSFFVSYDEADGFSVAVIDQDSVTIDMSSRFSGSGGSMPSNETWWVYQVASYSTGVVSSASYKISDSTPPGGANIIAKINMLSGDTAITDARFDRTVRTLPIPTKREDGSYISGDQWYGFLSGQDAWNIPTSDQKRGMNNAPTAATASNPFVTQADTMDLYFGEPYIVSHSEVSPVTRIQLSGQFYVGNGTTDEGCTYFSLRDSNDQQLPYLGTNGKRVFVGGLRQSDGVTTLTPSSDADSEGFFLNPYLVLYEETVLNPYSFSGDIKVHCHRKKQLSTLDQSPAQAFPKAGMDLFAHLSSVLAKSISGTPDSLMGNDAGEHLSQLLNAVNARINTNYPSSVPPSSWTRIWQSDNNADGSQTKTSTTFYVKDNEYAFVVGGYLSGSNIIAGSGSSSDPVTMIWHTPSGPDNSRASILFLSRSSVAAGTSWAYASTSDWTTRSYVDDFYVATSAGIKCIGESSGFQTSTPSEASSDFRVMMSTNTEAGTPGQLYARLFAGNTGELILGVNLSWSQGNGWTVFADADIDTMAIGIGNGKIKFYRKDKDDADHAIGSYWDHTTGWTSEVVFLDSDARCAPKQSGVLADRVRFALGASVEAGNTARPECGVTWHADIPSITSSDVSIVLDSSQNWDSVSITGVDRDGAWIYGYSDTAGGSPFNAYYRGYVDVEIT